MKKKTFFDDLKPSDSSSELYIRPFVPGAGDDAIGGREPFATLTYSNITIELDYTFMRNVSSSSIGSQDRLFALGCEQILKDMEYDIYNEQPYDHRDTQKYREQAAQNKYWTINTENPASLRWAR